MTGSDYNVALVIFFIPYVRRAALYFSYLSSTDGLEGR